MTFSETAILTLAFHRRCRISMSSPDRKEVSNRFRNTVARKYGWRVSGLLMMPAVGAVLGVGRSLRRGAIYIPYYMTYFFFNYVGILSGLLDSGVRPMKSSGR